MRRFQIWRSDSRRRGNVALEYALILPVLLMFILGIVDTGRVLWTSMTLARAVEAAARCGAVNKFKCGTDAQIRNEAVLEAWGLSLSPANFTVIIDSCGKKVQGTYDFTFIIPFVSLGTRTLTATACYPTA